MIAISNLVKKYGQQLILNIPSFQFNKGVYWIKGANGSGKTTLLKILAGLIPFEGSVSVEGVSQKQHPLSYRKLISWAEAEPLYPDFLTGKELLRLYQQIRNASDAEVNGLTRLFPINSYAGNKTATYSAGMLKKLSLTLSFIGGTRLILLDEPFITLDADACKILGAYISARHKENGTTFILSSHQDPRKFLDTCTTLSIQNQTLLP
ncbi:ABC transporter [Niabella ginsenosidivorans]|uniref:ABC transporter n=1 Tax=Niabella ginsenosidivorans TaxID=1176587 RepID=A0A1A9I1X1_9BACT|nr:ABC transporter ATP-binding protein [Niabella ginsenosidivorans]ANH81626.1 ABC transporter [Niabella ginsenosidivorans]